MQPSHVAKIRNLCTFAASLIVFSLLCAYFYLAPCFHMDVVDRIVLHPTVVDSKEPILKRADSFAREVTFPVRREGRLLNLSGILLKRKNEKSQNAHGKVVLFSHGNSGDLDWRLNDYRIATLLESFDVFQYDYEGYGRSQGEAHYSTLVDDALAAYDFLRTSGYKESNIIFYGESLGGGVTCELARVRKPAALILDNTFVSPEHFAKERTWFARLYPRMLFPRPFFNNLDYLEGAHPPCLIISGALDSTIQKSHSDLLSIGGKLLRLPESGHCVLAPSDRLLYSTGVSNWLATNLRG